MHQTIKKLKKQVKDLTETNHTSSTSQSVNTISKNAKSSVAAAIPTVDLSIQVSTLKPKATIAASSSIATAYRDLNDNTISNVNPSTSGSTHNVLVTDANSKTATKHKMFPDLPKVNDKKVKKN